MMHPHHIDQNKIIVVVLFVPPFCEIILAQTFSIATSRFSLPRFKHTVNPRTGITKRFSAKIYKNRIQQQFLKEATEIIYLQGR